MDNSKEQPIENLSYMRDEANRIFELTKGFTGEPSNSMKSCLKMANYVLQLTENLWFPVTSGMPIEKPFEERKILVYHSGYEMEMVAFYQDKTFTHPFINNEDGNPLDITSKVTKWKYLNH